MHVFVFGASLIAGLYLVKIADRQERRYRVLRRFNRTRSRYSRLPSRLTGIFLHLGFEVDC